MSKEIILNALDGIQDRYITEAAGRLGLLNGSASALNRRRESALSRFFSSGWGVAMICAVVSLSVLGGIVWAGQRPVAGPQDTTTESETVVETEAETETETTTETETEIEAETETTTETTTQETSEEEEDPTELSPQHDLVLALVEYLRSLTIDYELPDTSTAMKMDEIKNGTQALYVGFHQSECYFVCAYYDHPHKDETLDYCCATNFTWVRYKNPNEISETYKDLHFVVAFQIDKASLVIDIVNEDAAIPGMEHYQKYVPDFHDGFNASGAIVFDTDFIYLNESENRLVYHSVFAYHHHVLRAIQCKTLDDRHYVLVELYTVYPDGHRSESPSRNEFGKYYDALISVMVTGKYSVTDEYGRTLFYGLVEIRDFVNCINK